jgi:tRNA-2-methylthio-N6-dimethylallyladenosine synthase
MPRTLYLETFGCQMNVLDSELVLGQLVGQGYEPTADRDSADVVLYNTCSVREHAEQKVWSRLGELRVIKRQRPGLVIGVIGCMAERDGTDIFRKFPHVDVLCGPGELDKLPGLVNNAVATSGEAAEARGHEDVKGAWEKRWIALMGSTSRRSSTLASAEDNLEMLDLSRAISPGDPVKQAYVRITRGCNKFCTYCVVPYTRGPEVHRPPANIIEEVRRLADAGAREVTLLGQTINHYAYQHGDGRVTSFGDLLYEIHEAVGHLPRLRFVTSYPRDFTDDALAAMRDCERICRYLHVPAQHGSNRILKAMNRGYCIEQYYEFVDRAREMMPDVSIASDFIVGFPTETEEEFEATKDVIRRCRFKNSFIFKYSPRPGTAAIRRFADDVPDEVKKRRNNELLAVQSDVSRQLQEKMIGQMVELMVEGQGRDNGISRGAAYPRSNVELGKRLRPARRDARHMQLIGRTRGDQIVIFEGDTGLAGELVEVEITHAQGMTLFGQRVSAMAGA